jgi:REP element-mobilizing transposase RayT
MVNNLPKRKAMRWSEFDYNSSCAVFVTICVKDRRQILSNIVLSEKTNLPVVELTSIGKIIQKNILSTENIKGVLVDKYVIMPDHVHIIFAIKDAANTKLFMRHNAILPRVVSAFKRFCNKEIGENIFQRSFYDHIIRDSEDYDIRSNYINENPLKWYYNPQGTL